MTMSRVAFGRGLPIAMGVAVLSFLALLGFLLVDGRLLDGRLAAADAGINAVFGRYRAEPGLTAFLWVTAFGANPAIVAVAATASAFLWSARRLRSVAALWLTLLGAQATSWTIKFLIGRARPTFLDLITADSPSFPSGHATSAMAVYGLLAWLVTRPEPGGRPSVKMLRTLLGATLVLIALVGFSRIFLSLHHTSDVLGGFLVGWFWMLVGIAVVRRGDPPPPLR